MKAILRFAGVILFAVISLFGAAVVKGIADQRKADGRRALQQKLQKAETAKYDELAERYVYGNHLSSNPPLSAKAEAEEFEKRLKIKQSVYQSDDELRNR